MKNRLRETTFLGSPFYERTLRSVEKGTSVIIDGLECPVATTVDEYRHDMAAFGQAYYTEDGEVGRLFFANTKTEAPK